jgi:hypothetical protein
MLPIPSNALERSSARALGLITGYFQDLGCTILFDDTIHFDDTDDENEKSEEDDSSDDEYETQISK